MAFRNSSVTTRAAGVGTSLTGSAPSGTVADDYLAAFVVLDGVTADTITPPAGWTSRGSFGFAAGTPDGSKVEVFDKIATGSDSYAFTTSVNNAAVLIVGAWSGRNTSAPRTFATVSTPNTTANATPVSVGLTSGTAVQGDDIAAFAMLDLTVGTDTWGFSPPGSYTERQDSQTGFAIGTLATLDNVSAGAIGTLTFTGTRSAGTGAAGWGGVVIAIAASASTAPQGTNHLDLRRQAEWKPDRWDYTLGTDLLLDDFLPSVGGGGLSVTIDTPGAIALAGQSITMRIGVALSTQGAITLAGQAIALGMGIPVTNGSVTLAGQSVTTAISVALGNGALTLSGQSVGLGLGIPVTNGAVTVAGQSVTAALNVALSNGAITLTGQSVTLANGANLSLDIDTAGSITLAGQTVTLAVGGNISLAIDTAGAILIAGQDLTAALTGTATQEQNAGGWVSMFELARLRRDQRRRRERELAEQEREARELQDQLDRELAQLLYQQEQKDAERADLARVQALADSLMSQKTDLPRPILASVMKAYEERTRNALLQLERVIAQTLEEEEAVIAAILLLDE